MEGDSLSPNSELAEQLSRLLLAIQTCGQAVLPQTNIVLLHSIVETAARIFGAAAASIALVDEQAQTLEFKVAVGKGNTSVVGMSMPINKGIAGYVAMTGQPIAVSNVQQDARFAQDFAANTGYIPSSILATPLLSGERVIGVMEVLDKVSADSFSLQDMELLGIFANQAALAINQSQQYDRLGEAIVLGLKRLAAGDLTASSAEILGTLEKFNTDMPGAEDLLALADLFNQISLLGSSERRACLKILAAFAEYSRSKARRQMGDYWD